MHTRQGYRPAYVLVVPRNKKHEKIIFALAFFFFIGTVNGQSHQISYNEMSIRSGYPDKIFQTGYTDSGEYFITTAFENYGTAYYFDSDDICNDIILTPDNKEVMKFFIEVCNIIGNVSL